MVKLKEIAIVSAGQGAPQGEENYCEDGTPFVKAGNLAELIAGKDIQDIQKVSEDVAKKHGLKIYKRGTILFAKSGMSCLKGYVYVLPCDSYVVSHLACITPNEELSNYLQYYFKYNKPNALVKDPSYPSISLSDIGNLNVDIKNDIQRAYIVKVLDILSLVLKKQRDELGSLNNLVKARFVEMFSESKCGTKKLNEITDIITKGTTPTTAGFEFTDSGINFFKIESITEDHIINLNKVAHVNEECHKTLRRSQLREGDILFSIAGVIGRTAIISKGDLPGNTNQALAIIRLSNDSGISQKYLISALDSPEVFEQCRTKKRGVAQINLSLQDVGNIEIPIPSPMKQKTFELFVKQVDKSKFNALKQHHKLYEFMQFMV